jgi:uncharacterized protein (DUF2249 family)
MVIRPTDRVAAVLRDDERLLEVFVAASPLFERLRNAGMRRTMGRLVTVAQAARLAGLEPAVLVDRLNGGAGDSATGTAPEPAPIPNTEPMMSEPGTPPPALREIPSDLVHDLDVRDELRQGREPFGKIMAARKSLPPGGVLRLRAIFEPVPLYAVMARQGLDHWMERLADDDWVVWFYPADVAVPDASVAPLTAEAEDERLVLLDVRGLEPPEPMVRTLAALETLPAGKTLVQINVRTPQFLLPKLEELGFSYDVREQDGGPVRVFIQRREHR